ncbi:MAG: phosphate ABC transporter substrate-binding protein PstS [Candidatus Bathyarchaeota archaeon]|nr:phosphate ABC transporter substrate-binding protein PstS [Candidatus Bathyarchaeota archaeon]
MKITKPIALAIVAIAIVITGIGSYAYLSQPISEATPSPTPTATATPTPSPTPSSTPQSSPTPTPSATATPTPTPSATPAPTPTPPPTPTPGPATLNGAGATFPQPLINAIISHYTTQVRTNVQINYQGGGSGAGISAFTSKTVDFACTDAALTASQRAAAPNALHIPETIGAITITYNLPGVSTGLKLTGTIIADIYLGAITKWNDPAITALNPTVTLPNQDIIKVRRSDGSGTTNWFTKYLSAVSSTWNTQVGSGTTVQWPGTTIGASGNANVAATVNSTQYALGYVELAYALQNSMPVAAIQNPAGNFIMPTLASTTAAAESIPTSGLPTGSGDWAGVNILNAPGSQAYPIVVPTYMLLYQELNVIPGMTIDKAKQLVDFIWYVVHDGQQFAASLQYAALPSNLVQINEATLRSITFNGQTLITS